MVDLSYICAQLESFCVMSRDVHRGAGTSPIASLSQQTSAGEKYNFDLHGCKMVIAAQG